MNKVVDKFLLAGDKFMPGLHLTQPGFTYSTFGLFTKHREIIQIRMRIRIYKNKLDKACFAHDAACSDSKYVAKRTISDRILKDKANEIAINPRYDGYRRRLASTVYKFFDKKTGLVAKPSVKEEVAQKVHRPVTNKFKRKKVYARLKDNVWVADLAEMESLPSKN